MPYTFVIYPILFLVFPRLWHVCQKHGYITAGDFVRGRFGNRWLALAVAITGIVATMDEAQIAVVAIVYTQSDEANLSAKCKSKCVRGAVRLHDFIGKFEFVRTSDSQAINGMVMRRGIIGNAGYDWFGAISVPGPGRLHKLANTAVRRQRYVIVHELAHIVHPNHGSRFFELIETMMPDWKERKRRLERSMA